MSDSGGTLCPAPNFSYELFVRKIEYASIEGVDLSRWRIAINAGEPVMPTRIAFPVSGSNSWTRSRACA